MMPGTRYPHMAIWAARDIQRHAGRSMLLFACLASLVFLTATALLFSQALDATWAHLLDQAPDLVVRRIDSGGWAPLPADDAVALSKTIPGVLDPTPRLWGVVPGPEGPVTVVASIAVVPDSVLSGITPPSAGQAVVGQALARALSDGRLSLGRRDPMIVKVIDTFPADTSLATHDLVWMTPDDARHLLGLAPDEASDLAVHLFRREEAQAIQADLAAAFPWPVRITDRTASALRHRTHAVRTGGIAVVAGIPALLALLLIITGTAVDNNGQRAHWGLLKALGWTTADIVRLQVNRTIIVGVPAVMLGLASAYAAVFYPPAAGVTAFWITGGQHLATLTLVSSGAAMIMLEIAALVGLPFLAAVFLTSLRVAADTPWTMLQADPWN
jgi:lipoprotein-releasing system permease protein